MCDGIERRKMEQETIDHRPLVPPTPEQAALAVLDDLARRRGITVTFNRKASASNLRSKVDTLEQTALSLIQEETGAASRPVPKDVVSCLDRCGSFNQVRKAGLPAWAGMTSENMTTDAEAINAFCDAVN